MAAMLANVVLAIRPCMVIGYNNPVPTATTSQPLARHTESSNIELKKLEKFDSDGQ